MALLKISEKKKMWLWYLTLTLIGVFELGTTEKL